MSSKYDDEFFGHRFRGWFLFGIGMALVLHFVLGGAGVMAQSISADFTATSPEAWMEQFFDGADPSITPEILVLSESGDYAIATYAWGEGGGYVVLKKDDSLWLRQCGSGGAPDGGHTFVQTCDMALTDAQALWAQFQEDREAAGYAI